MIRKVIILSMIMFVGLASMGEHKDTGDFAFVDSEDEFVITEIDEIELEAAWNIIKPIMKESYPHENSPVIIDINEPVNVFN